MSTPLFRFSQVSYVTNDLEEATRALGRIYGIERFARHAGAEVESPGGKILIDTAQAFVGDRHIEVIRPAGGPDGLYRDLLDPDGFSLRHHHFGHVTHDAAEWSRIQDHVRARGWRVVLAGNYMDMMHYAYVDTRAELGHYLEFMYQTELGREMFVDVPRY